MPTTLARPYRFLLTVALAMAFAGSATLTTNAIGSRPATASEAAATPATLLLGHPRVWAPDLVQPTASWVQPGAETAPAVVPAVKVVAPAAVAPKSTTTKPVVKAPNYAGTNHLWIPSLGISHSVAWFACTRATPPGAGVYRWGCAGANNAYLFGHAWSTLKPLHDAYVSGRLHTGMVAYYADATGRVRAYKVTAIKVVTPDQTTWAIAAQSRPSITLQTCVGANSQYRLLVRLVATN